ncbi:MAG: response regulator [Candidatus Omnitrophica bacterium]|nr:response regulator [Candidatus Omnitrophota bacterium]
MKKIFMIEDNEDHALLIRRGLEGDDSSVTHYSDGPEAVKACRQIQTQDMKPDLILLDLKLPGMDGFEVLKSLRSLKWFEHVPIVMLTTSSRKEEIEKAYQLGASGYVTKTEDFGELVAKLKRVKDYWFHTVEIPCAEAVSHERAK